MIAYDDGSRDEAIGWLTVALGGPAIAAQAHRARRAGHAKVADHLLGWADLSVAVLTIVDSADRRRHLPSPLCRRGRAVIACPWTSALECAMAAERGAAGTSDYIKPCPAHQLAEEAGPLDAFLAGARVEAEFLDGADLAECGCPIEYLQAEGDHQPRCGLARG